MSTHNISFYEDLTKIIFQLSSNTHLICCTFSVVLQYVEDPIPCSDTVVASPNKTNPAQDNSIITNPVVLDHESSNSIVTKDHEQSNFTVAEDTEQSNYNSVVTNDHEQSNSIVTNNCIESRNISKCSKRETLDELELSEGELNNNDITDAKSETNDTTGCAEIDATETTKCKKCDVENITEEPITNTKDAKVKARNCTEGMEVVASSTAGIVLESRDTKETIESEATDITEAIEMEIAASDSTDMKDEVMDSTECKEVEATGSTECIEAVDNNIIVIKMDTKEAAETEKCMEVEDQEITESLREETHTIVKSKESCALGTTNNVEEKAQEIAKSEEKTNTLKVDCDASDSDTNRISASKGLKTIDVKMHADKDKVKIDMNDFLYKTKPQSVPSNQKSTVQNESNLTVLDFSFPELYMTKNQEPAMVLTVKKDTKSMPEDSYQSSLEGQLEEENTGNVQLRACDRNGIGSEDANLENYLSTGMFTSSRLKKHNYTVYHYEGEKEEDLPIATSDSEQSHGKEKKTYSRKSTRRHTCKTKSEQSASFDESPESFEEYLESDEQFEEEFYRSLLCRQKAADSSLLKTDESLTKPISEHKQSEQYLGLTMSGGDSKKCDHIVFHDFQVENDNTEIKSSPKRTRILIKTKLDDGTVIRRQVWRLKSSDELGEVEQTEEEKSEEQAKNCSVWRQKLPKDLRKGKRKPSKKSSKKAENEKTGQVWRIKSPEELGKKTNMNRRVRSCQLHVQQQYTETCL